MVLGNQVSLTREKKMGVMGFSSFCGWLFPEFSCLLQMAKRKFRQEMVFKRRHHRELGGKTEILIWWSDD